MWAGGARWKGDVLIFEHLPCHFSSVVSPPREEDDYVSNLAVAICYGGKVNGPHVFLPK